MPHDLATRSSNFPTAEALEQINTLVTKLSESKALPSWCDNPGKLMMCVLAGREAGMGPIESLNSFYLVAGKFTIFGSAVLSQLKRAGYKVVWKECTDKKATVTIISPEGNEHTESYTIEEAIASGVTKNTTWQKYPKNMCRWRALSNGVRFTCPEVLTGLYIKEDIEATQAEAMTIDIEPTETINPEQE